MIIIVCTACGVGVRTHGDQSELDTIVQCSDWHPSNYPCPTAECQGRARLVEAVNFDVLSVLELHDLTPHEAFVAFSGLGFPAERDCGQTAVEQLFSEKRVKSVKVRQLRGQNRSVLDHICFEDGTRMFLASGVEGAVVYRIAPPHSYAEQVLRG